MLNMKVWEHSSPLPFLENGNKLLKEYILLLQNPWTLCLIVYNEQSLLQEAPVQCD